MFEEDKTISQMNRQQTETMLELSYRCPANRVTANAQSVLYLLYGTQFEECEEMSTRRSFKLVKDVVFTLPETAAWIEDNFPDPVANETLINYYLPEESAGKIVVSDVYGRQISEYNLPSGENSLVINVNGWAIGIYFYSFVVNGKCIEHKKMIVAK
ncbi:MAG TPA: T9SS type A sorting domain-containing protein [Bacteroidales bacterium]|nr:T9SS type A sorting domain-containing protein [Bacteroidales bacterium]